jgi:isoleucyl-tRNA synthetase
MSAGYQTYGQLNLPNISEEILQKWATTDAFKKSVELREGKTPFVFYEGPPSANGMPGIHHVISRTLKDLVCRYKTMQGFQVKRKGGWDTHGLPIELGVEKMLGITKEDIGTKISVEDYNKKCREVVMQFKDKWDDITQKMGYWVDLEKPYVTFENNYIETLWWCLSQLYKKDYLYESVSIQPYSPAAGTGLSSHELNQPGTYKDVKDTSATVMFKVASGQWAVGNGANFKTANAIEKQGGEIFFMAWTTTPWTLPSNLGLTVGPNIDYILVETVNPYTFKKINVILAKALFNRYFETDVPTEELAINNNRQVLAGSPLENPKEYFDKGKNKHWFILAQFKGRELDGMKYDQLMPFEANTQELINIQSHQISNPKGSIEEIENAKKRDIASNPESLKSFNSFRVVLGDFVTTDDGTGIVHTAPAHGADDFKIGKANRLGILYLVEKDGSFKNGMGDLSGRYVKNYKDDKDYVDVNVDISVKLKYENRAFKVEKYEHSYPHCWRTDKPIIYYPLDAWFIKTTAAKDKMVKLNKTINWKPASTGTGRFGNWLENMVDWNLSRSRFWGTPLPIWKTEDGEEEMCVGSINDLKQKIEEANNFYLSEERINNFDAEREVFFAKKAMDYVLTSNKDVEHAVCRTDIDGNFIHFLWGEEGIADKDFKKGYGISKIIAKRKKEGHEPKEILHKIAEVLALGKINRIFGPEKNRRIELEYHNHIAFVNEYQNEAKYNWLLTGFKRKSETDATDEVSDPFDSTQINPTHSREDLGAVSDANIKYIFIQPIFRFNTTDLHKPYVDDIFLVSPKGKLMKRVPDLIDVWFDSGAMPYAQWGLPDASSNEYGELRTENFWKYHAKDKNSELFGGVENAAFPADFIAEGVDQTRGWFYTLHALGSLLFGSVAYKTVVSNGLVLDKNGVKMSKRLGNIVDPFATINSYGADATRWYLITNASPWDSLKFDEAGIQEIQRKFFGTLYNTYQFFALYANVDSFTFKEKYIPVNERPEIDQWILSSLNSLIKDVTENFDAYEPTQAGRAIEEFVDSLLSNWYVRLCRRRFWKGEYEHDKIAAYQTLYECLETISKLIAPIAPFFADWLYSNLNNITGRMEDDSVHHSLYPVSDASIINAALEKRMLLAQDASSLVLSLRKKVNIKVRQPLQKIFIPAQDAEMIANIKLIEDIIKTETNIKEIEILAADNDFIRKKAKANFKTLGKRLGAKMKWASTEIAKMDDATIAKVQEGSYLLKDDSLAKDDEQIILNAEDIEVITDEIPGYEIAIKGSLTVALDITITDELQKEGNAREFVNKLQTIRKESGFELTDRILVQIAENGVLQASIMEYKTYICAEILADSLEFVPQITGGMEVEINENMLTVIVIKK